MNCLNCWCQSDVSSKGEIIQSDTLVTIPIQYIKAANEKLLEREALLKISKVDSILIRDINAKALNSKDNYMDLINANKLLTKKNIDLTKELNKSNKGVTIFGSIAGAELIVITLLIIL